jgi:hypothetical protein
VVQELGSSNSSSFSDDLPAMDQDESNNFLGICCQELLARGTELLKRTRKGTVVPAISSPPRSDLNRANVAVC